MILSKDDGFTLVEIVVAVALLGLIGAFFYSGIRIGIGTSQRGKTKVESVSILQSVTEELASSNLSSNVNKGDMTYSDTWVPNQYSVKYRVTDTSHGVYRLTVEVSMGADIIASNSVLAPK
ncbi:MAG: type II secretion system protein [Clostridia bacterium]|nr:type II secretion system protein [Clostridia bacterium]